MGHPNGYQVRVLCSVMFHWILNKCRRMTDWEVRKGFRHTPSEAWGEIKICGMFLIWNEFFLFRRKVEQFIFFFLIHTHHKWEFNKLASSVFKGTPAISKLLCNVLGLECAVTVLPLLRPVACFKLHVPCLIGKAVVAWVRERWAEYVYATQRLGGGNVLIS